ncbi:hypothetical protein, partial [Paenibacillus sp. HB172176]|uniref:hypothetical protein n=1 Tax=Paenibacillus sp. HB172176 TaxID=2493690 RepID=UPI00198164F4
DNRWLSLDFVAGGMISFIFQENLIIQITDSGILYKHEIRELKNLWVIQEVRRITPYSRCVAIAPWSGRSWKKNGYKGAVLVAGKPIQPDNPALPNRVAATPFGRLRQ